MDSLQGEVLITGGAGTMGRELIRRSVENKWDCHITIFSTDAIKHARVKAVYPNIHSVIGDIRDFTTVYNAMSGKDIVIHGAAVKYIPESEYNSIDTYQINVDGSLNVAQSAIQHRTPQVVAISTDKSCHAANCYGATKYLTEKIWQEFSRLNLSTKFTLTRYGNILESTGSVVEKWRDAVEQGFSISITSPEMTRFFLSPKQGVDIILASMKIEAGCIYIPKARALSVGKLAQYTLGDLYDKDKINIIPIRPGEKLDETLLTLEECRHAVEIDETHFILHPTTSLMADNPVAAPYTSDTAPELTRDELMELLRND